MPSDPDEGETRIEHDPLGPVRIPADALYGPQTQRAVDNVAMSRHRLPRPLIGALAAIKAAAAITNTEMGVLAERRAKAIIAAAEEVGEGRWDAHFPVDIFQTGSGTSSNMNANEVIARRGSQLAPELDPPLHGNDDVNRSQSSNDVIPSAIRLAACALAEDELLPAIAALHDGLQQQAQRHARTIKPGRTHLMDAMPVTLGQVFGAYARRVQTQRRGLEHDLGPLRILPLGGTAVGTGIGAPPGFGAACVAVLARRSGRALHATDRPLALQAGLDDQLALAARLRGLALLVLRLAEDIRLLASGPRFGLGELRLPVRQPGSSIMPDKSNPIVEEAVIQACCQVVACDQAIASAAHLGHFELATTQPLVGHDLLEGLRLLAAAIRHLDQGSVRVVEAVDDLARRYADHPILVTALAPHIGHEVAARIAQRARTEGRSLREIALEEGACSGEEFDRLTDVAGLVG